MSMPLDIRGSLKLPPLALYQKGERFHKTEDISSTFDKLYKLHWILPDPLRDLLCTFVSEEDVRENHEYPKVEKVLKVKKLPSEIYISKEPNPASRKRTMSSIKYEGSRKFSFQEKRLKGILMSAIIVRWLRRSTKPPMSQESVAEEMLVFGPIESITTLGKQSALIIYENIISACRAVSAFSTDTSGRNIRCYWFHKFMSKNRSTRSCRKAILNAT
ncbi:testis expressed protein 56-like [Sminthopsis crassicaudata]|uniref:testis expressed protein 56-like n=1 Tax=Sminthopsis crassicaudata TaxID=9301 RepID=UPI003D686F36